MKPVADNFFLNQIDDLKLEIKRERSLQMHLLIGRICMFVLFMWLWCVRLDILCVPSCFLSPPGARLDRLLQFLPIHAKAY